MGATAISEIDQSLVANSVETAAALAESSGRKGAAPLRRVFVQPIDRADQKRGGPLAALVRRRDRRALVLYLMIVTMASAGPWNVHRDARVWARLLDLSPNQKGRTGVSKTLRRLRDLNLIEVKRTGRQADIYLLHEDGRLDDNGKKRPYTYPDPKRPEDRYLKLPHAFWAEGWFQTLELPGLAMLLILLAEKDEVILPLDRIPDWYGISRNTAQRGFHELANHGLVAEWVTSRKAPLAPEGFTYDRHFRLLGSFARPTPPLTTPIVLEPAPTSQELGPALKSDSATPSAAQRRRARRRAATTRTPQKEVNIEM